MEDTYEKFVARVLKENRTKDTVKEFHYKHHIFPRNLYPLLRNKPWNLLLLTYKEHAYAHFLLTKCTVERCQEKMQRSFEQYFNGMF